jgi:GGDEF domain-containing protein
MASMRKASAIVLVAAMTGLAMLAWWSMLAAERAAVQATADGARQAAIAAALAVRAEERAGNDVDTVVALAEQAGGLRLVVRDGDGEVIAGRGTPSANRVTVAVPGSTMTVSAEMDASAGLGLGRYSKVITAVAFLVMSGSVGMLVIVSRDRRRTQEELVRLGLRWEQVAAADDTTGLGNRARFLEDAGALIARGSRYGNAFGVALFDVVGDRSEDEIKAISTVVAGQARTADLCYRVAPSRFVTILPEQDQSGAALAADRVRRAVEADGRVPVRSGVAAFTPWLPCEAIDLLHRAELDLRQTALLADGPEVAVTAAP